MKRVITASIFSLHLALSAQADEYYPSQISLRSFGTDQGNVGDCQTAAEVGALESAFANRGYDFVQLSLFYRHAANWVDDAYDEDTKLDLDGADKDFIHRAGPLLPDYMWPEDGHGYDPSRTGKRPHPAQITVWDPNFPSASTMGFSQNFFRFGSSGSLDSLKAAVAAGNAVVLSLHGFLFQPDKSTQWDHVDGLLKTPYSWDALMEDLRKGNFDVNTGLHHAMMVVGFDDSLYAGQYPNPGALIVRNSWNDDSELQSALANPTPEERAALSTMRLKVFSRNLPGFYALPYQYILDLQANQVGNYEVLNLDYAAFASQYVAFSSRYHIETLPFVCDRALGGNFHASDAAKQDLRSFGAAFKQLNDPATAEEARASASQLTYKLALREMQGRQSFFFENAPAFQFARVSSHEALPADRASDFYSGKFLSYYCPDATNIWPGSAQLEAPGMREAIQGLGEGGNTFVNWYEFLRALSEAPL